jgi:hypothetical protein
MLKTQYAFFFDKMNTNILFIMLQIVNFKLLFFDNIGWKKSNFLPAHIVNENALS